MQSHTYNVGTESFKTLSIAFKKFPFSGCLEFFTIGFIYCKIEEIDNLIQSSVYIEVT